VQVPAISRQAQDDWRASSRRAPDGLLILNGTQLLFEGARLSESVGWLAVEGERIAAVGEGDAPDEWRARAGRMIDARHMAVLPGLVNGHTHLSQTFLRGLADDRPLLRWLKAVMWPAQAAMMPEDMYLAALLGLVENLHCGATTVVQHHKLPGREYVDAACRAAAEVGIRVTLARGWVDLGASGEPLDTILAEMQWLYETWHGRPFAGDSSFCILADQPAQGDTAAPSTRRRTATASPVPVILSAAQRSEESRGRIRIASGPLAPWRCSDDAMRELTALARFWGIPTHIHVAEAQDEIGLMRQRCGKGHIEWLADLGCLGPDTQLVHAVHVTDAELDLIAEAGATVVHCPTSNMYLASGAAPVRKMLDRGIPVALGTDGSGANNSQDLLECAKIAALLAKHATGDAQAVLPADVLRMMALGSGGAEAQRGRGADAQRGIELVPGVLADITIVNLDNARCQPVHNAASALVYNASGADVHTVIVGGEILLDAGRVTMLDEAALFEASRRAANDLMRRAGIALGR
jgi:5-methylthioadenosine/S-adenosylhomocysteine deaminase